MPELIFCEKTLASRGFQQTDLGMPELFSAQGACSQAPFVICVDSDVFLIDLRYPADPRAPETKAFLKWVVETGRGATTIVNVLEITGVLSFHLNGQQLVDFYAHFPRRYNVRVLPSHSEGQRLPALRSTEILRVMLRKAAFGDAIIATLVNRFQSNFEGFVTWNTSHFVGRVTVPVFTPATFAHG